MLGVRFGPAAATNSRFFSATHLALFGVVSCPAADDHHGFIKNRRASANEGFMRIFIFKSAASGGVGIAALQIARAMGLRVLGTAGTPKGLEISKREGAHEVFDHHKAGYQDEILQG